MSTSTALTVIAVSFSILTLLALAGVIVLFQVVKHLVALEKSVVHEIVELRKDLDGVLRHARDTSEQISKTVKELQRGVYNVGLLVSGVTSWLVTRKQLKKSPTEPVESRPWWINGLALTWSLVKTARKRARSKSSASSDGQKSVGS